MKLRKDGKLAAAVTGYVDDFRIVARDEEAAWSCSSRFAKRLCWLGMQDAARKRRRPSMKPGAWAGATVSSDEATVRKGVTEERWKKLRTKVWWLARHAGLEVDTEDHELDNVMPLRVSQPVDCIHYKTTESIVGFLVYVAMTYRSLMPYLKGIS